ncbi:MAG: aminopeptidase [Peptoniphilus sp.]|nr:aminopeptidase [Peptoniphilus sp.]
MKFKEKLYKYSELIIKKGLNIKEGDILVIRSQVKNIDFVNILAEIAFKEGASDVKINFRDENFSKLRYEYVSEDVLKDIPQHFVDEQNYYMDKKAKFLSLTGEDPNLFKDIDSEKLKISMIANSTALKSFSDKMMNNETSWCVAGAAVSSWAKVVFPDLSEDEAVDKLWDLIFYTSRTDSEDPVKEWEKHISDLKKRSAFLNESKFALFEIKSDNGTDLKLKMPKNYFFAGAEDTNAAGETFIANIPTEEVFSMPHKLGVDGIVYNTKPLNLNGSIVDDFFLKFADGKVVDFHAEVGYEVLKNLLDTDEGAKRLGEIAFVPYDSPISNTNVMFYNTLYDENASCHLALGKAYPSSIKGGDKLSAEELEALGANDSLVHVDFMIGDKSTNIWGYTEDGEKIQIFKDGNFII